LLFCALHEHKTVYNDFFMSYYRPESTYEPDDIGMEPRLTGRSLASELFKSWPRRLVAGGLALVAAGYVAYRSNDYLSAQSKQHESEIALEAEIVHEIDIVAGGTIRAMRNDRAPAAENGPMLVEETVTRNGERVDIEIITTDKPGTNEPDPHAATFVSISTGRYLGSAAGRRLESTSSVILTAPQSGDISAMHQPPHGHTGDAIWSVNIATGSHDSRRDVFAAVGEGEPMIPADQLIADAARMQVDATIIYNHAQQLLGQ
jgi:hypothetical protein